MELYSKHSKEGSYNRLDCCTTIYTISLEWVETCGSTGMEFTLRYEKGKKSSNSKPRRPFPPLVFLPSSFADKKFSCMRFFGFSMSIVMLVVILAFSSIHFKGRLGAAILSTLYLVLVLMFVITPV